MSWGRGLPLQLSGRTAGDAERKASKGGRGNKAATDRHSFSSESATQAYRTQGTGTDQLHSDRMKLKQGETSAYPESVLSWPGIVRPKRGQRDCNSIIVPTRSGVSSKTFFLVVYRARFDHLLDRHHFSANIIRNAIVAHREARCDPYPLPGCEEGRLVERWHQSLFRYIADLASRLISFREGNP